MSSATDSVALRTPAVERTRARWLAPLGVFAIWALAILVVAEVFGRLGVIPLHSDNAAADTDSPLWTLRLWDYFHYESIAENGYPRGGDGDVAYAYFPLWPAVLALGSYLGSAAALATLVTLVSSAAAFVGIALANPSGNVRRTAIALACIPTSYSLLAAYPDSIVLAAAVWAYLLARRDRWAAASALAFLAGTGRANGFLAAIPLLLLIRRDTRRSFAPPIAALAGAAAVELGFWWRSGSAFTFFHAEETWRRTGPQNLVDSVTSHPAAAQQVAFAVAAIALCVVLWRRGPNYRLWTIFAAAVIAIPLASGNIWSIGRYALLAFPLAWAVADGPVALRTWRMAAVGAVGVLAGVAFMPSALP